MSAEFANAMAVVMNLPDGISGEELRARGPEAEQKVPAYIQCRGWAARRYDPGHTRVCRQPRRLGDMA